MGLFLRKQTNKNKKQDLAQTEVFMENNLKYANFFVILWFHKVIFKGTR